MPKRIQKAELPQKICINCQRPFTWRKKWEKVWVEVKYCSEKCRKNKHEGPLKAGLHVYLSWCFAWFQAYLC